MHYSDTALKIALRNQPTLQSAYDRHRVQIRSGMTSHTKKIANVCHHQQNPSCSVFNFCFGLAKNMHTKKGFTVHNYLEQ